MIPLSRRWLGLGWLAFLAQELARGHGAEARADEPTPEEQYKRDPDGSGYAPDPDEPDLEREYPSW